MIHDENASRNRGWQAMLTLAMVVMIGCSAADQPSESDPTAEVQSAMGEPACATDLPDIGRRGKFEYTTPREYGEGGCWRAFIHDAWDMTSVVAPTVAWADERLVPKCVEAMVSAYLYKDVGGVWETQEILTTLGRWNTVGRTDYCVFPSVKFKTPIEAGASYRIVGTGRVSRTGASRAIRIYN